MRIDNKPPKPAGRAESAKGSKKSAGAAKSGGKAAATSSPTLQSMGDQDSVLIQDHETTLDVIRNMVADAPDVRMDAVDEIVGKLKSGKYKIDFERVAEGFIRDAIQHEVLKRKGRGRS